MVDQSPFAVFIVAPYKRGYAATTRAADRGEAGKIGLPGGKVDPGESPIQAVLRESAEEGWKITGEIEFLHSAIVEGRLVHWYILTSGRATPLKKFKEAGRIQPILASLGDLIKSGYGNDVALQTLKS